MLDVVLRQKMTSENLSSHAVAEQIGTSHTTVLRALQGETLDLKTLVKFADFLHVRPSELIDALPEEPASLSEQLAVILSYSPELEEELSKAVARVRNNEVSVDTIREIVSYAIYKFNSGSPDDKRPPSRARRKTS